MTNRLPLFLMAVFLVFISGAESWAQDCANPTLLCGESQPETQATTDGVPSPVPAGFCLPEAPNALFFSFNTLDTDIFPALLYEDSTATLTISGIVCDTDTLLGDGLGLVVFGASDPCDPSTYDTPVLCEPEILSGGQFSLEGLEPATTYYVMITGLNGPPPATGPSECSFSLAIAGPAVTYELEPDWYAEGNEDRVPQVLFDGETLVLFSDPIFQDVEWFGQALNNSNGPEVTANPEGVGETFTYQVEAEINGCTYTDEVEVTIFPAVVPFNAFTPNDDGINDTWEIANIREWPNAQITVFSRWGQKVYQQTNYDNDWDGDDLPAATYYYVIELNPVEFNSEPYTGSVTIIR